MFGADVPSNIPVEMFQYKSLELSKKDLENVLYNTAARLLKI
jgi:predicted TIM-barrel fold metal-dependent hydrolase